MVSSSDSSRTLLHEDPAIVAADYGVIKALQPSMVVVDDVDANGDDDNGGPVPRGLRPGTKLPLEVQEIVRLALAILTATSDEDADVQDVERDEGTNHDDSKGTVRLVAHFPLVGRRNLPRVPASCAAASLSPRELGAALLRGLRTAKDEAAALGALEALLK